MSGVAWIAAAALAYTWIAYPALIAIVAIFRRRTRASGPSTHPSVSVVVASREDDRAIQARIDDLVRTSYPLDRLEIVVALDHGREAPADTAISSAICRVRVIQGDAPGGKAASLNAGVRACRGEVLIFADTAQTFAPSAIPVLVAALQADSRLGAVSGALHDSDAAPSTTLTALYWRFERWLRGREARVHSPVGVTGAIYAMRRVLWTPLRPGLILDDLLVPMRLALDGYRVGFAEEAVAVEGRRFAPEDEFRRKTRTLTGVLQLCAWLPAVLNPLRNPLWLQFVSHKLLRLTTPYLLLLLLVAALWMGVRAIPGAVALALLVLGIGTAVALLLHERLRRLVREAMLIQASIVRATGNAVRGDWDVWR